MEVGEEGVERGDFADDVEPWDLRLLSKNVRGSPTRYRGTPLALILDVSRIAKSAPGGPLIIRKR